MAGSNAVFWTAFAAILAIFVGTFHQCQLSTHLGYGDALSTIDNRSESSEPHMYSPNGVKPVKAAFVVLVRNVELLGMRKAMQSVEDRFNHKYNYPYIFLNDVPFTEEFINGTSVMTKANTTYGLIPKEHWSYPDYIDTGLAREKRADMKRNGVAYGDSESYRFMCNYQSGYFFRHPLLEDYDYYWRIEPDVEYSCDIDYDPFLYMKENKKKYSYTVALYEYPNTIPTLWESVKEFINTYPELIPERNAFQWLTRDGGEKYSGCHFWSNFEIADLKFFRSREYMTFYDFLSRKGGFFYERWGDAIIHSIAVALFLQKEDVHWFKDIGYFHNPWTNCPLGDEWTEKKCTCKNTMDYNTLTHPYAECGWAWQRLPGKDDIVNSTEPAKPLLFNPDPFEPAKATVKATVTTVVTADPIS